MIKDRGADFSVIGNKDQGLFRLNNETGELQELVPPVSSEPDKAERAKLTASLRKEASAIPAVKSYRKAVPAVKSAIKSAGQDNKAADLDIIFAVMKAVDPESVVRESEQQVAISAGSPAERFRGFWNEVTGGGRLTAQVRQELLAVAIGRANAFRNSALSDLSQFQGIADEAGVTAELAIPQLEPLPDIGAVIGPGEAAGALPARQDQVLRFDEQGNMIP